MRVDKEQLSRLVFQPYKVSVTIETKEEHKNLYEDIQTLIHYLNDIRKRSNEYKGFKKSGLVDLMEELRKAVPEESPSVLTL